MTHFQRFLSSKAAFFLITGLSAAFWILADASASLHIATASDQDHVHSASSYFLATYTTTLVTEHSEDLSASNSPPLISADGSSIVLLIDGRDVISTISGAYGFAVYNLEKHQFSPVSFTDNPNDYASKSAISENGRYVAFGFNGHVVVRDRETGTTSKVSVASDGTEGNGGSGYVGPPTHQRIAISADGRFVAFTSDSTNLVSDDTNNFLDVFVHDRQMRVTSRVSVASDGSEGYRDSYSPSLSADGRYVAFVSYAFNFAESRPGVSPTLYVHDRETKETTPVSVASDGSYAHKSFAPSLSADGRYVTFASTADNLVDAEPIEYLEYIQIYRHDRETKETILISRAPDGTLGNEDSESPSISAHGRYIVFQSDATNLLAGQGALDVIYLYDIVTGLIERVSVTSDGVPISTRSRTPSISADGRTIAFASDRSVYVYQSENERDDNQGKAISVPVVFVPGFAASKLLNADNNNEEIWPAIAVPKSSLSLNPDDQPFPNIFASDVIRSVAVKDVYGSFLQSLSDEGFVEYLVAGNPARRTLQGCDLAQKTEEPLLFVFAYDWRLDNAINSQKLSDYVACIRQFYPDTQVDIIAHSMGGLLSRRYILDYPGNVRNLVTIGTPWFGAPKSIASLENGDTGVPFFVITKVRAIDLLEFFPGVHQLLPSPYYYALGERPFSESGWDINGNGTANETYSYQQLVTFLDAEHPQSLPGSANQAFHTPAQDDWRNDNNNVKYHIIVGQQKKKETIGGMSAFLNRVCRRNVCYQTKEFSTRWTLGDGTVPIISAERQHNGVSFNHSNVSIIPFLSISSKYDDDYDHTGLMGNSAVQKEVYAILQPSLRSTMSDVEDSSLEIEDSESPESMYLDIKGAEWISGTDSEGNHTIAINGVIIQELPNVGYHLLSGNTNLFIFPTELSYTLTFALKAEIPLLINLTRSEGDDTTNTMVVRYVDFWLPHDANIELKINGEGVKASYDSNDDGVVDTVIEPTATVKGSLARDTTPPTVTITSKPQGSEFLVTINAQDTESGVQRVLYSFDNITYQIYSEPFLIDPAKVKKVYAGATDKVGNESESGVHTIADTTTLLFLPIIQVSR